MDLTDLHPPDDYTHRFFIWHEWILANGPLTAENVFEYFTTSMFYDKQSSNQVLRMQTVHTGVPILNEAEELKRFTGTEFALVHAQPPSFFIIHKRERLSPEEVKPLCAYFIMNNRIYQSPDVYTVLSNRLLTSLYSIQSTLDTLRTHRPDYTPRTGFVWPIIDPSLSKDEPKRQDDINATRVEAVSEVAMKTKVSNSSGIPKRQQNNMLLMNAMQATATHSKIALSSSVLSQAAENIAQETLTTTALPGPRTSVTPAPIVSRAPTPKVTTQEAPAKAVPGGGKKKRKRTGLANAPEA